MNVQHILSTFPPTAPLMRFLAYVKNDLMRESTDHMLVTRMMEGWREMNILDVGCGECKKEKNPLFAGVDITGVDIYKPSITICKKHGVKAINGDMRIIDTLFKPKTFDIIWMIDVIEHVTKEDGYMILDKVEKIARRQILLFTPATWFPQDPYKGNKYYMHRSIWSCRDFEKRDYACEILKNYYADVRGQSKMMAHYPKPFHPDALWAVKLL